MKKIQFSRCLLLIITLLLLHTTASHALTVPRWLAQTLYIPVYSHIYADSRFKDKPFQLTAILSIRNTDKMHSITVTKVDYYDSEGRLLSHYLEQELRVAPLASTRYIVPESDTLGGSGAKFIVSWSSSKGVTEPIIQGVMIGTKMQQGISFITNSQVLSGKESIQKSPGVIGNETK